MYRPIFIASVLGTLLFLNGCATDAAGSDRAEKSGLVAAEPSVAAVEKVTAASFERLVLRAEHPVIVQYHAAWCSHCRALENDLRSLATDHSGDVAVVSVDIDDEEDLAVEHGVDSVPTLQVYAGGEHIGTVVGVRDRSGLEALFQSLASGDASRVRQVVRVLGPAEPGSACARLLDASDSASGTCTEPAS